MKCVLLALAAATVAVAAAPVKLCTINRMVLSEENKVLYTGKKCVSDNPVFAYDSATKLLKFKETNLCVKMVQGQQPPVVTAPCQASDIYQHWELKGNRVASTVADRCLKAQPATAGAVVGLGKCDWTTSLASGQFLAECKTVEPAYLTITATGNKRLSEFNGALYADNVVKNLNELFTWDYETKMFKVASNNQCLDAFKDANGKFQIHTWPCDVNNGNQKWNYDTKTKKLTHATHAGQCLDVDPTHADHRAQMWECTPNNPNQQFTIKPFNP